MTDSDAQDADGVDRLGLDNELWRYKLGAVEVFLHEWAEGRGVYTTAGTAETPVEAAEHDGPAIRDGHYRVYRQRDDGIVAGHHPHAGRRESYSPNDGFDQQVTLLARLENVE